MRAITIAHLRLPRHSQKVLISLTEGRAGACHTLAAPIDRSARGDRAVEACADAATVEILSAVRHRGRPFADDRPELVAVVIGDGSCVAARGLNVSLVVKRYGLEEESQEGCVRDTGDEHTSSVNI